MPKLPVRIKRIELTGDYAGFWLDMNTSVPMRILQEFESRDIARVIAALALMTRGSNLVDYDDKPVDLATVDGWREMPAPLLEEVAERLQEHMGSPKANSNGSSSRSTSEGTELSPVITTT